MSAGIGPVLLLRWFWWRINAWSELAAMIAPYLIYPVLAFGFGLDIISRDFELSLILIVIWSSAFWIIVTMLTKPSTSEKLESFYKKVHPGGIGWKPIAEKLPDIKGDTGYGVLFMNWALGSILVMFSLFGFGKIIFKEYASGAIFITIALTAGFLIYRNMSKTGWGKVSR